MEPPDDLLARLPDVLEKALLAMENDESPNLLKLCDQNEKLAELARKALDDESEVLSLLARSPTSSSAPARLEPGIILGDFEISSHLGSGGMGSVYLAHQRSLGRMVAVKVVDSRTVDVARFRREATIAGALDHPNIVPVYSVGEVDGLGFLAMKWLTGPALDRIPDRLAPRQVAEIGSRIATALQEIHQSGIVHRDVKPANVILDDGVPFLVDFGLARSQRDASLTASGAFLGTLRYVAPEQLALGAAGVSHRSDIYSLGATLYEISTGRPSFPAEDRSVLMQDVLTKEPADLDLGPEHRDLETIILRAMDKESVRRFATAQDMADDIGRYLAGDPILSRRIGLGAKLTRVAKRHRRATMAITALLLVAGLLGGFLWKSRLDEQSRVEVGILDASQALSKDDIREARAILRALGEPDQPQVQGLIREADALEALQRLLDQVFLSPEEQDSDVLLDLVEKSAALGVIDDHKYLASLAQSLALFHLKEREQSLHTLDELVNEFGDDRATIAIRTLIESNGISELPREMGASADEHVFAAIALRRAGADVEAVEFEIKQAREIDDQHFRAQLAEAYLYYDDDRVEESLAALRALTRPGRDNDAVYRKRTYAEISLGLLSEAEQSLSRIPERRWTALDRYHHFQLLWNQGKTNTLSAEVRLARERTPDSSDPLLDLSEGHIEFRSGNYHGAAQAYEATLRHTSWKPLQDDARAGILLCRLMLDFTDLERLRTLDADAKEQLEQFEYPLARSTAFLIRAGIAGQFGNADAAIAMYQTAIEENPTASAPRVQLAYFVCQMYAQESSTPTAGQVSAARSALESILDGSLTRGVVRANEATAAAFDLELYLTYKNELWPDFLVAARATKELWAREGQGVGQDDPLVKLKETLRVVFAKGFVEGLQEEPELRELLNSL